MDGNLRYEVLWACIDKRIKSINSFISTNPSIVSAAICIRYFFISSAENLSLSIQ